MCVAAVCVAVCSSSMCTAFMKAPAFDVTIGHLDFSLDCKFLHFCQILVSLHAYILLLPARNGWATFFAHSLEALRRRRCRKPSPCWGLESKQKLKLRKFNLRTNRFCMGRRE